MNVFPKKHTRFTNMSYGIMLSIFLISVMTEEGTKALQSTPTSQTQCRICGFFTSSLETMNMHQQAVHGKEYVGYCVDCGKGFKSNLGYSIHKKKHEGEKDAFEQCYICDKRFAGQSRLAIHMRKHSQVKSFVCLVCNKSYKHAKNLKDHKCGGIQDIL